MSPARAARERTLCAGQPRVDAERRGGSSTPTTTRLWAWGRPSGVVVRHLGLTRAPHFYLADFQQVPGSTAGPAWAAAALEWLKVWL